MTSDYICVVFTYVQTTFFNEKYYEYTSIVFGIKCRYWAAYNNQYLQLCETRTLIK